MFFYIIAVVIFFATLAMLVQQGVWSNLITLMAIVIGGITAFGVHQPLVVMVDERTDGSYTYLLDFFILWLVFAAVVGLLKLLAGYLSKNRVNFPDKIDNFGGAALAAFTGYVMMSFAMSTFHAAPLGYDLLGNAYEYGDSPDAAESAMAEKNPLLAPTIAWLRLCDSVLTPEAFGGAGFSSKIFVAEHGKHRKANQALDSAIVKRG